MFSLAVICVCVGAALTMFFRVREVSVTGNQRYSVEDVLEAANVETGDNLFLLNKYAMAARIGERLPYVEAIRIHKHLPDTLSIELEECGRPLALAQDGAVWLVSASGKLVDCLEGSDTSGYGVISGCKLLFPAIGKPLSLVERSAPAEDPAPSGGASTDESVEQDASGDGSSTDSESPVGSARVDYQRNLLALLAALGEERMMEQVDAVRLDDPAILRVEYAGRFTVELPYGADFRQKFQALAAYLKSDEIQDNMTGIFDMTKADKNYFRTGER